MIKAGIIGLGKMGLSHCSILGAHPDIDLIAVCDTSKFVLSVIEKYSSYKCFTDYKKMIDTTPLYAIVVATPTKYHYPMVLYALNKGLHVFCEKPFSLDVNEAEELAQLALEKKLVNQVGYHNRFIGTFQAVKRLVESGIIGEIYHVRGEAYGPVVVKPKGGTWRSNSEEGGGCLYDYASHVINLIQYLVGNPDKVSGTILKKIYSKNVEDAVYSSLFFNNGCTGQLSVNWSEETYRKMSTSIEILGKKGKIISDAQECKIYLKYNPEYENLERGWNTLYITDQTKPVWFNLRGEEYSAQIDYFINCIKNKNLDNINSFATAAETDKVIKMLIADARGEN
jgi:predicted dehydrogenase